MNIKSSEVTPEHIYLSRRDFIKSAGFLGGTAALLAACAPALSEPTAEPSTAPPPMPTSNGNSDELGNPLTDYRAVTGFNNFYEFSTNKEDVAPRSAGFKTSPWQVEVGGMIRNPMVLDMDDILTRFDQEERIYRLRCVEGWSMVIPWNGFPLSKLLDEVEPTSDAKYVRFETLYDRDQMPGQKNPWYQWPYTEGLRLDEAYNDLAILSTGVYGSSLLPQNGAPIRLVVPWKYGFKSIKSIVKIDLVDEMPVSLWMDANPSEYGFYANVNPTVNHPRWSQSTERRIGETGRVPTLMFNGYEEQVAGLYTGMDLRANY